jgi:hypothetical protein
VAVDCAHQPIERQDRNVRPFIRARKWIGLGLDLGDLFFNVIDQTGRALAGAECCEAKRRLAAQMLFEIHFFDPLF